MVDLEPGDYLYQSDQELFLVLIEESEDSYTFAAHGWRDIDKDRVEQYITDSNSKVHSKETVNRLIDEEGDEATKSQFNKLKQLFAVYENADLSGDVPDSEFSIR